MPLEVMTLLRPTDLPTSARAMKSPVRLTELIERGNPEIPLPSRDTYRPVVLSYGGVKSWSKFSKKFGAILFVLDGSEYRLDFAAAGSNADDPARTERVAPDDLLSKVLAHILSWNRP